MSKHTLGLAMMSAVPLTLVGLTVYDIGWRAALVAIPLGLLIAAVSIIGLNLAMPIDPPRTEPRPRP